MRMLELRELSYTSLFLSFIHYFTLTGRPDPKFLLHEPSGHFGVRSITWHKAKSISLRKSGKNSRPLTANSEIKICGHHEALN